LNRHLEINHIKNCTVIGAAVSSAEGEATFDPSDDRCTGRLAASGSLHVRTLAVDGLVLRGELRPPNLMKIDIEGGEFECLQGASSVIQEFRPVIFLATHGKEVHISCTELLGRWNYHVTSLDERPLELTSELIARP
jgi:FkbM family methyltransferase